MLPGMARIAVDAHCPSDSCPRLDKRVNAAAVASPPIRIARLRVPTRGIGQQ